MVDLAASLNISTWQIAKIGHSWINKTEYEFLSSLEAGIAVSESSEGQIPYTPKGVKKALPHLQISLAVISTVQKTLSKK